MFRLRAVGLCLRRPLHGGIVSRDQVQDQLRVCSGEDQVFEVVGRNKAKLNVSHVGCAIGMLWQFQKERPVMLRTIELVRGHPQFLTLRVLAENKISLMDDPMLVDLLYHVLRLNVEHHDSLVQHLVSEAWLRLDRLPLPSLSKFAICLRDQSLYESPLMGQIADIVDKKMSSVNDARILTTLMISISSLVSPRLRDALIHKASDLLDTMDQVCYNDARRVVQFLRRIRHSNWLVEKCNRVLLRDVPRMDVENVSLVVRFYHMRMFYDGDFRLAAKQRLLELVDSSTDAESFTKLFIGLRPMAGQEMRERLESTALLLADELSAQQALAMTDTLEEIRCRNHDLIHKIASIFFKNMHVYKPLEVARMSQALILLHYQSTELFNKLRSTLVNFSQNSVCPHEVVTLIRVLSMLPHTRLNDGIISRGEAVLPQCSLYYLSTFAATVAKWMRSADSYRYSTPSKYARLLQTLNRCGRERLLAADRLDPVLDEIRHVTGEWFEEMLLEEVVATLQRMADQVTWANVVDTADFLARSNHLCPLLMDRIADVVIEDINKIHYTATYAVLLPFALLNYDSTRVDDMFDVCIRQITPHISSFAPHMLVLLAFALAMTDRFPEELIQEIFNVDFLAKLDATLETMPDALNMRVRQKLMELNRAVCLQCPEFQVPWFHEQYCQQMRVNASISPVQQQVHRMLGEVLGGINCARVAVLTPYFYTVDFECVLDKHRQPLAYSEQSQLQICDDGKVSWGSGSLGKSRSELPPGTQRVAVDFLDSRWFCKNSHHMNGQSVMRKRHLEILGYHIVQIPHFEWNSMELSTQDAWKEYLKKKIFADLP